MKVLPVRIPYLIQACQTPGCGSRKRSGTVIRVRRIREVRKNLADAVKGGGARWGHGFNLLCCTCKIMSICTALKCPCIVKEHTRQRVTKA